MISNNKIVVLLTGTINPNSFKTLVLIDPEVRKKQYIDAISYYLIKTSYNIVFTENSGVSLKKYFKGFEDRIEFLVYKLEKEDKEKDKGKGFKELGIIDYTIENSKRIREAEYIIKITGRLKVLNLTTLVDKFLAKNKKNSKIVSCNIFKLKKMDSRCFIFSLDFWSYLKNERENVNLNYSFEMALWNSVICYNLKEGVYKQLFSPLRIKGVSGGFGTSYDHGLLKFKIKQIMHFLRTPFWYNKILK